MKKSLCLFLSACLLLAGCGKDDDSDVVAEKEAELGIKQVSMNTNKENKQNDKWAVISGNPQLFLNEYNKFTPAQKYYFCSAFSMGAMSASKPATASAMVSYFLGLGVEKYAQGIDDNNYYAFDMGKNIFRYELVVNYILDEKICENVMLEATDFAKDNKISTDEINEKGKFEAKKIVDYIKKDKK